MTFGTIAAMILRMLRRHVVTSLMTATLLLAGHSYAQDQETFWSIVHILRKDHPAGSLQYYGHCGNEHEFVTRNFPITTTPTSDSGTSLQILREMFAKDPEMQVTEEPDGIIRMVDQFAPQDLLNVKIEHLSFDDWQKEKGPLQAAFPSWVMEFIVEAPEVKAFMKEHDIGRARLKKEIHESSGALPHLVGELNNVTLSQALDYLATTYHGLWVYKECPGNQENKRIVDFVFYDSGE